MSRTVKRPRGATAAVRSCQGKWGYASRRHAEDSRKWMERQSGERFRVYGCTGCGGFHLTSRLPGEPKVAA